MQLSVKARGSIPNNPHLKKSPSYLTPAVLMLGQNPYVTATPDNMLNCHLASPPKTTLSEPSPETVVPS